MSRRASGGRRGAGFVAVTAAGCAALLALAGCAEKRRPKPLVRSLRTLLKQGKALRCAGRERLTLRGGAIATGAHQIEARGRCRVLITSARVTIVQPIVLHDQAELHMAGGSLVGGKVAIDARGSSDVWLDRVNVQGAIRGSDRARIHFRGGRLAGAPAALVVPARGGLDISGAEVRGEIGIDARGAESSELFVSGTWIRAKRGIVLGRRVRLRARGLRITAIDSGIEASGAATVRVQGGRIDAGRAGIDVRDGATVRLEGLRRVTARGSNRDAVAAHGKAQVVIHGGRYSSVRLRDQSRIEAVGAGFGRRHRVGALGKPRSAVRVEAGAVARLVASHVNGQGRRGSWEIRAGTPVDAGGGK